MESDTEGVVLKLQGMSIQEWTVSARKVDRGPLYIALNVPFSISNEQVGEEMGKYGEVKEVREQEYRKWSGIANGHRTISFQKINGECGNPHKQPGRRSPVAPRPMKRTGPGPGTVTPRRQEQERSGRPAEDPR